MPDLHDPPQSAYPDGYPYAPQPGKGSPYFSPETSSPASLSVRSPIPELLALLGCGFFNLVIGPIIEETRGEPVGLIAMAFGIFAGQLAVLSIWLVWSEIGFWRRLLVYWALLYALGACFVAGLAVSGAGDVDEVARGVFCALPLVALAAQLPLWALRIYFGWQIRRSAESGLERQRALSIGDIFGGTVVAALSVAAVRFVTGDPSELDAGFWIGWSIAVPSIAAISLIGLPLAIFLILRLNRPGVGCGLMFGYAVVLSLVTLLIIGLVNRGRVLDKDIVVGLPVMCCTLAGMLFAALMLARSRELQLRFPRDPEPLRQSTVH
jgi:hypothetical protein